MQIFQPTFTLKWAVFLGAKLQNLWLNKPLNGRPFGREFGWNFGSTRWRQDVTFTCLFLGSTCQNKPCHLLHVVACMHHFPLFSFVHISLVSWTKNPTMLAFSPILFCFSFFQFPPLIQSCHLYSPPLDLPSHLSLP